MHYKLLLPCHIRRALSSSTSIFLAKRVGAKEPSLEQLQVKFL